MPSRPAVPLVSVLVVFALVPVALAVALSGCDAQSPLSTSSSGAALSPIVRIQAARKDALGETSLHHLGSGFVVSEAGHLVTAFHVIENFRQLVTAAPGDVEIALVAQLASSQAREGDASAPIESWPLQQIGEDPANDLALLKAVGWPEPTRPDDPALGVAALSLTLPAPDTAIELAGYPFGARGLRTRPGRIIVSASALSETSQSLEIPGWFEALGSGGFLLAEVETHRGNSGSPVSRKESGAVVGLCSAILLLDRNEPAVVGDSSDELTAPFTVVIPSRTIATLLDEHGVDWRSAD